MFGLSLQERIIKQISMSTKKHAIRMKYELHNMFSSGDNDSEDAKFIIAMFLTCVQVDVLDYFTEKYPQYEKVFNQKLDEWHRETQGFIQAGHLFDTFYSTISGRVANPDLCIHLNKMQRNVIFAATKRAINKR